MLVRGEADAATLEPKWLQSRSVNLYDSREDVRFLRGPGDTHNPTLSIVHFLFEYGKGKEDESGGRTFSACHRR